MMMGVKKGQVQKDLCENNNRETNKPNEAAASAVTCVKLISPKWGRNRDHARLRAVRHTGRQHLGAVKAMAYKIKKKPIMSD